LLLAGAIAAWIADANADKAHIVAIAGTIDGAAIAGFSACEVAAAIAAPWFVNAASE
jgi:hypothetical protein